jgi:cell division transport system permease protein
MKLYVFGKIVKDSIVSLRRNMITSFGGIMISFAAFFILGIVVSIYFNVDFNIERVEKMPEIEVFMYPDADEDSRSRLEDALNAIDGVVSVVYIDKDQAFDRAKGMIGEDTKVLELLGKDFLPESFLVDVDLKHRVLDTVDHINGIEEAESINYSVDEIESITRISRWSRYFAYAALLTAFIFLFVIITNLIRITVTSRYGEIRIKRFLGADNIYIFLPFVFDGVIISLTGAIVSWIFLVVLYSRIFEAYAASFSGMSFNIFEVAPIESFRGSLLVIIILSSLIFGLLAGAYAVRRYLGSGGSKIA